MTFLTLPKDPDVWQGNVYVNVKDQAGNELEDAKSIDGKSDKTGVMATGGNSNIYNTDFMIENKAPYLENSNDPISVVPKTTDVRQQQDSDVYSGDVTGG